MKNIRERQRQRGDMKKDNREKDEKNETRKGASRPSPLQALSPCWAANCYGPRPFL
ncbi:ATP synthase subunit alpha, partial [Clarias magur]